MGGGKETRRRIERLGVESDTNVMVHVEEVSWDIIYSDVMNTH